MTRPLRSLALCTALALLSALPAAAGPGQIFIALAPCRIADTRVAGGPIAGGTNRIFKVLGSVDLTTQGGTSATGCGVPGFNGSIAQVQAIAVNLAAASPTGAGFLTAFAGDASRPLASTLNYTSGTTIANGVIVPVRQAAPAGTDIKVFASTTTDVFIDVTGYFTDITLLDGSGSGIDADTLDGLGSTSFATSGHNHFGQSWLGSATNGLYVENSSAGGTFSALKGRVTGATSNGAGVWGETDATDGRGVFGRANATTGVNYGVRGVSNSGAGFGVFGTNTATSGIAVGVHGDGADIGVEGFASGNSAHGVHGEHTATTGVGGFGVSGYANGSATIGVRAKNLSSGLGLSVESVSGIPAQFDRTGDGTLVQFSDSNTVVGNITLAGGTTVSYNAFTGSHYAQAEEAVEPGVLVTFSGRNSFLHARSSGEPIYGVLLSRRANDPAILGSYLGRLEPSKQDQPHSENPDLVAAVGNGEVWLADTGEDIQPGDELVSSDVPGHAMKDSDRFPVSHVFARAAEPVRWNEVTEKIDGVKHKRISILFDGGKREKTKALRAEVAALRQEAATQSADIARLRESLAAAVRLASRVETLEAAVEACVGGIAPRAAQETAAAPK